MSTESMRNKDLVSFFLHGEIHFLNYHILMMSSFLHCIYLESLSRVGIYSYVNSYLSPWLYSSIPMIHGCFYVSTMKAVGSTWWSFLFFVFLLGGDQDCFTVLVPLYLHTSLWIFPMSVKNVVGILIQIFWICILLLLEISSS